MLWWVDFKNYSCQKQDVYKGSCKKYGLTFMVKENAIWWESYTSCTDSHEDNLLTNSKDTKVNLDIFQTGSRRILF